LDLFPDMNQEEVLKSFEEILQKFPKQSIKNVLTSFAPERFVEVFLDVLKIDKAKIANNMSKIEKTLIAKNLKGFEMTPEDIMGFDNAMVTKGGVSLEEIDHKTMQSKIISNLFFAGEIIDVNGDTGGFNLQACWSTGYVAGKNNLF
jgi:predicted Rossmann fold flavoprotein